ncbi:type II secretion system F family protein [Sinomonas atrocyanea]|uniref:type II secretion system F family protein n=1 Tax=Sinomonas atrocyanea TaxID=37927 RepID=UPI00285F760F|nr:type II secretion system F family protein [Sinomonas atrocyanea]MDR6620914.1 tight adherence protein C [Sinomonas atrocyanea]
MSLAALGSILAVVAPASYLAWSVASPDRGLRRAIAQNLGLTKGPRRSAVSISDRLAFAARRATPSGYSAWLDKKLAGAGRPQAWPLERVLVAKPILALVGFALGMAFFLRAPGPQTFVLVLGIMALCFFVPDILLHNSAQKRRAAMSLALPTMLDQMLISVEAGVGFESAMSKAAENSTGPLADEFIRTLQDIRVGRSRREAYLDLGERAGFPELRSFIRSIVQADQYGIAIANVLRVQAKEMRVKRRQRAEEHAMKIPVKILFPLIFSILPALFIIVLGPVVLSIMHLFS